PWAKESGSAPHAAAPRPTAEAPEAASRERRDSIDAVLSVRTRLLDGTGARPSRQCVGLIRRRPRTVTACQRRCKSHAAGPGSRSASPCVVRRRLGPAPPRPAPPCRAAPGGRTSCRLRDLSAAYASSPRREQEVRSPAAGTERGSGGEGGVGGDGAGRLVAARLARRRDPSVTSGSRHHLSQGLT